MYTSRRPEVARLANSLIQYRWLSDSQKFVAPYIYIYIISFGQQSHLLHFSFLQHWACCVLGCGGLWQCVCVCFRLILNIYQCGVFFVALLRILYENSISRMEHDGPHGEFWCFVWIIAFPLRELESNWRVLAKHAVCCVCLMCARSNLGCCYKES